MPNLSLGIIETIGLAAAIEAADVCVKSANVSLVGYEFTKGDGMTVVKIEGYVGAVEAAIQAAKVSAVKVNKVVNAKIIPRPNTQIDFLIKNEDTVGFVNNAKTEIVENKPNVSFEATDFNEDIMKKNKNDFKEKMVKKYTCNICKDPKCTRKKGDLKSVCIHYKSK